MDVSPAKHSYAWLPRKRDYRIDTRMDGQTDGQTDAGQSDPYVPICFAGDTKIHCIDLHSKRSCLIWLDKDRRSKFTTFQWQSNAHGQTCRVGRVRKISFFDSCWRSEQTICVTFSYTCSDIQIQVKFCKTMTHSHLYTAFPFHLLKYCTYLFTFCRTDSSALS